MIFFRFVSRRVLCIIYMCPFSMSNNYEVSILLNIKKNACHYEFRSLCLLSIPGHYATNLSTTPASRHRQETRGSALRNKWLHVISN